MYLNGTPIFEWYVLTRLDLRTEPNKIYVLERDWTTYLKITIIDSIVNTIGGERGPIFANPSP